MRPIAILTAVLALYAGPALAAGVGFQRLEISNGDDKPIRIASLVSHRCGVPTTQPLETFTQLVAIDAPVHSRGLPLVVISHGTGGSLAGHYDTAMALASAGFVVAALSHTGDTWDDRNRQWQIWGRPLQLRRLIDYTLREWPQHGHIDPKRIGAFGFSAGGFTVLAAVGGVPDLKKVPEHCSEAPDSYECQFRSPATTPAEMPPASSWFRDARIKAAVIAAPALGYTFGFSGLRAVRIPIQLWRAQEDHILPHPYYAEAVHIALPRPPEYHVVPNADHFDFLAPCSEQLMKYVPAICGGESRIRPPGFPRAVQRRSGQILPREIALMRSLKPNN